MRRISRFNPGRGWVPAASVSLKVNLKKGVNSLITTALIGGAGGWMNLDYLDDVEGRLTHLHANRVEAQCGKAGAKQLQPHRQRRWRRQF